MKKAMVGLLAALVMATAMLPITAMPVRAETVQSADQVIGNPDDSVGQTSADDSEWRYVPVRRFPPADSDSTSAFDGRLLTARDLQDEQN